MTNASNATLVVERAGNRYIYKPKSGERPLWDFPEGTLHLRERCAYLVSEILGWNLVPTTTIEIGPEGVGSFQEWVSGEPDSVDIFPPNRIPQDWKEIISGQDEAGKHVTLAHENSEELFRIAIFDVVVNNADRKAGHILQTSENKHWAIDHGVTFNVESKLRTVLWGWIDEEISLELQQDLTRLSNSLENSEIADLLSAEELSMLQERIAELLIKKTMPGPSSDWPAIPWPIF